MLVFTFHWQSVIMYSCTIVLNFASLSYTKSKHHHKKVIMDNHPLTSLSPAGHHWDLPHLLFQNTCHPWAMGRDVIAASLQLVTFYIESCNSNCDYYFPVYWNDSNFFSAKVNSMIYFHAFLPKKVYLPKFPWTVLI